MARESDVRDLMQFFEPPPPFWKMSRKYSYDWMMWVLAQ